MSGCTHLTHWPHPLYSTPSPSWIILHGPWPEHLVLKNRSQLLIYNVWIVWELSFYPKPQHPYCWTRNELFMWLATGSLREQWASHHSKWAQWIKQDPFSQLDNEAGPQQLPCCPQRRLTHLCFLQPGCLTSHSMGIDCHYSWTEGKGNQGDVNQLVNGYPA